MISVAAMKSRTFSSYSCSSNKQVCRSLEEAETDRQASWPMEKFHTIDIILSLWMGVGRWAERFLLFSFLGIWILSCPGVQTFL